MRQVHVRTCLFLCLLATLAAGTQAQERGRNTSGQTTIRTEQELKLSIEVPALPSEQCEATAATSYFQRNTVARVTSTISTAMCAVAGGEFKVALRIRDDAGEVKTLEFDEAWQRTEQKDVVVEEDYPIGDNVELVSARVRGLTCTCATAPAAPAPQ